MGAGSPGESREEDALRAGKGVGGSRSQAVGTEAECRRDISGLHMESPPSGEACHEDAGGWSIR